MQFGWWGQRKWKYRIVVMKALHLHPEGCDHDEGHRSCAYIMSSCHNKIVDWMDALSNTHLFLNILEAVLPYKSLFQEHLPHMRDSL